MSGAREPDAAARPTTPCPDTIARPLDPSAAAAIVALVRALEVFDPQAALRAAFRTALVDRLCDAAAIAVEDRVDAIGGSLLAEAAILLSHTRPAGSVDVAPDPSAAVLSASMLGRLPGLGRVARTVRHQHERWDGSGGPHGLRGPDIPSSSRLLAVASTMVGMPGPHRPPNWTARRRRVRELAGSALDPELVRHAVSGRLDEDDPEPRLEQIIDRLDDFVVERGHSPVEALASIGAAVRAAHSIPDVLVVIGEQARRALGADRVSVGRLDHAGRTVEVLVNIGDLGPDDERFPAHEQHPLDGPIGLGKVLGGEGLIRSIDEGRADDPATASLHQRGLRSEAVWPIAIDDTVWGVVWATTSADGGLLAHDRLDTLRSVTTHVASAVTQAERRAEFEALALRDPLTGLGNRRVLDMKLHEVFSRPSVDRRDVGLIMCDVDGLKVVNDNRGHAAGDELLIEAARALQEAAATVDGALVCRIGGDEFCIILDGGGLLSAHPVADLAGNLFSATGEGRSLSIGVAIVGPGVESPFDLLRTADDAQYAQKRARKGIDPVDEAVDTASRRRHRRG